MRILFLLFFVILAASCEEDITVKPNAMLRLEYSKSTYDNINTDCPYTFLKNNDALIDLNKDCGMRIYYPQMKATLFLTYREVRDGNFNHLLADAQKLVYDRNRQARGVPQFPFENKENKTFGTLYEMNGDVASQSKFFLTDSTKHFLVGALYFKVKPNFDSIYPAVQYMREDIRTIMETLEWKGDE